MNTSKEKEKSEFSLKSDLNPGNKFITSKESKNIEKEEDYIFNYSNDLLNENIKFSPMVNPIPFFTVKKENSTKNEITTQNTFYSKNNNNKQMNINNIKEENKKDKTKILNKNLKKTHLNNCINNNRYFRQYSPNLELNNKNEIISYSNKRKQINNTKLNYEIFLSNKKKFVNNINRKKLINPKNILSGIKKYKIFNNLYFFTDNFYESNSIEEKLEKFQEKNEEKKKKNKIIKSQNKRSDNKNRNFAKLSKE